MYMHPFVITADLTRSMEAAMNTARREKREPEPLDDNLKNQDIVLDLVACIDPKMWKFSRRYVGALTTFYAVKAKTRKWLADQKWLEQDWRKVASDVDLFATETGTAGLSLDSVRNRHWTMGNEIISKFVSSRMSSEFVTLTGKFRVTFDHFVGGLCKGWLNDSPVDFCLETMARIFGSCYVLSALTSVVGFPSSPSESTTATKFVILPVNLKGSHWGIIIAQLHYTESTDTLRVHPLLYEPLIDEVYHEDMEVVWNGIKTGEQELVKKGLVDFVERWRQASTPSTQLHSNPIQWIQTPQQPDFESCGVLVVAQVYSYITENLQLQHCNVFKSDVQVMRLRMLWVILCSSREQRIARATADKTEGIEDKLNNELK
ncbi:hypothetical protein V7S43_008127 [Phytophthora oleae]|uniref:Ubiquitin-like protease family profile domain-containing protein n=1 Tax=Phytophthora oleae TaxID=2107226 RepID=A0ABD3FKB3_9STRA